MWKWGLALFALLVVAASGTAFYLSDKLYLRFPHTVVPSSQFGRTYAPAQLQADFQYLTSTMEHIHPDFQAVVDRAGYGARKSQIMRALDHPMTRVEFYDIASQINGSINDGHTQLRVPAEEWQADAVCPPLGIDIDENGLLITRSYGDLSIPANSRLVSLNGVDAAELARWMMARESAETVSARRAYAASHFPSRVWAYGIRAPYDIVYRPPGAAANRHAEAQSIALDAWNRESGFNSSNPMQLTMLPDHIAELYLRDFDQPESRYSAFLKQAFQQIKDNKISALILDLRKNNGGDSRESDELQTYISDSELPALEKVSVKTTPEVKAIYRTLLPEGFRWIPLNQVVPMLRGIDRSPDNGMFTFQPEAGSPVQRSSPNPLSYHGDLFVLIGPYTYSTAVLFVAPLKYWHRATLVGETTGEPMTFFGDNYEFDLPNTKLVADVSHKVFYLLGSKGPHEGVEPDIAASSQMPDALLLAMKEIDRRRALHASTH
jgi:hypothetical protein